MKFLICALLVLISFTSNAQYPFEKNRVITYTEVIFKKGNPKKGYSTMFFANYKNYRLELTGKWININEDRSKFFLFYKNKLIKTGWSYIDDNMLRQLEPLYIADINGDGLSDFKIAAANDASGLAGSRVTKIFLFAQDKSHFKMISFGDFYGHSNKEYDFNNDGNYEILGQNYVSYKNHGYWSFDLYNYKNGTLVNVSSKYGYPIMTPFSYSKVDYNVTNRISKKRMKQFSLKLPDLYTPDK